MRASTWCPLLSLVFASYLLGATASAQNYPDRAVQLVVANTPGSSPDVLARYLSERLALAWHQPVTVQNRPGAAGIIAADGVAKSAPDGYQLLIGAEGPITILPSLGAALPYDPQRDLMPIASLGRVDFVLVTNPKTGWRSLNDFVAAARSRPGRINYASAGNGSPQHMGMELLKQRAGIYVTHIPYRGGPLGMQDVIGGQVDVMLIAVGPALAHIKSGRLIALGVASDRPNALLPGIPAISQTYAGYRAGTWFGLFAPANTPSAAIDVIESATVRVLSSAQAREDLAGQGIELSGEGSRVFAASTRAESQRYRDLAKYYGLKAD